MRAPVNRLNQEEVNNMVNGIFYAIGNSNDDP